MKRTRSWRVCAIIFIWLWFAAATLAVSMVRTGDPGTTFPANEITRFVDGEQFATLVVAGFVAFGLFALIRHKSENNPEQERSRFFSGLVLDELGSASVHFGALLMVCTMLGAHLGYTLGGVAAVAIGAWLMERA